MYIYIYMYCISLLGANLSDVSHIVWFCSAKVQRGNNLQCT